MIGSFLRNCAIFAVLSAIFYQLWLKEFLAITIGVGRAIQPIEDFPYTCRRIEHERLGGCEDLWLDEKARVLYAACTGVDHRLNWNAAMGINNLTGRRPGGSELIALDIDNPGSDGLFGMHSIDTIGYDGANGDGSLDLVGFDAEEVHGDKIRFYLVNHRPPVNADRSFMKASKFGPNMTIDIFELQRGKSEMQHLQTVFSLAIWAPNRVAVLGNGAFTVSNTHSVKNGLRKEFDPIIGGGNVAYCAPSGDCHVATQSRLKFPNGLTKGKDGRIYVPSSVDGTVRVFELQSGDDNSLKEVDVIPIKVPLDNLAVDAEGDIFAAAFPDFFSMFDFIGSPYDKKASSSVFRIRKTAESGYEVKKILEDKEGTFLSGTTTARHDAKTGRIFTGGALTPWMAVCDPK